MNKDLKEKWITALRSGKYKQGKGQLRDNIDGEYHYCCLGILCEVAGLQISPGGMHIAGAPEGYEPLQKINKNFNPVGELARMNDDGHSFEEIADYIEENIPVE